MKDKWGRKDIDDGNELTLKTLNDLREDIIKILREAKCPNPKATAEFIIERKRAEAIKWVKKWQEQSWTNNPEPAEAFMEFFNLTEEDLK